MHKVERNQAPNNLIEKNAEWLKQLGEDPTLDHGWDNLAPKLKEEIRAALRNMYEGCCCYCEGRVEAVSYLQIEHFKPKSSFKELCYDYSNLHYCCEKCNFAKGKKFDEKMFSPSDENPEDYIRFVGEVAVGIDNGGRGSLMIDTLKLNEREELKVERVKLLNKLVKFQKEIENSFEIIDIGNFEELELVKPFVKHFIDSVEEQSKHGESYCTMFKHNFSESAELLKALLVQNP